MVNSGMMKTLWRGNDNTKLTKSYHCRTILIHVKHGTILVLADGTIREIYLL